MSFDEIPGLFVRPNFVTPAEEAAILAHLTSPESDIQWETLARRRIAHFHRTFIYGENRCGPVDGEGCHPAPPYFWMLVSRMKQQQPPPLQQPPAGETPSQGYCVVWPPPAEFDFDQLTVNEYVVREGLRVGIAPHVDSPEHLGSVIASVSLSSHTVMRFRACNGAKAHSVFLPPRSLLIMSGEARYHWTHGIAELLADIVDPAKPPLLRGDRWSLTFRKARVVENT